MFQIVDLYFYGLAAFFLIGAAVNLRGPTTILEDYRRWGYPQGFNVVTGILELSAAILLVVPGLRPFGALMACLLMGAAVFTVLYRREPSRAVAPGGAFVASLASLLLTLAPGAVTIE